MIRCAISQRCRSSASHCVEFAVEGALAHGCDGGEPVDGQILGRTPRALPVEDLLPQDVCVPAVLGEFAQYVEVHPAQRERAAPVAVDPVVQPQG